MITPDGLFDWMLQVPGIPDKIYSTRRPKKYKVNHSIVGPWGSAVARFMSTERLPNGRYTDYAAASVHYLNPYEPVDGWWAIQMYDVRDACFASGTTDANLDGVAGELEGGAIGNVREPMTDHQVQVELRAAHDLAEFFGWDELKFGTTLREHNQFAATACPSGRYARFYAALTEEEEMSADQERRLARVEALIAGNGYGRTATGEIALKGEPALEAAEADGGSLYLGIGDLQAAQVKHEVDRDKHLISEFELDEHTHEGQIGIGKVIRP